MSNSVYKYKFNQCSVDVQKCYLSQYYVQAQFIYIHSVLVKAAVTLIH